ncbi:MAG: bifunctional phosphopantothenoylcysteine decarboxylase/phosphopantothenate--cysteine ligase CoaBC [Gammaproteobacteria bacterium]|jgi:phosphopantothenoylcysteine decarboxylase/phosphopantothenate--cysteine ligase
MNELAKKRVLLGICGGIAAYKSADLVRRLRDHDLQIRVVMTPSACEFITPLTLQALSGHPVHRSLLDEAAEAAMGHIELARWADIVLIAPVTANTLAKLAHGLADELLCAICLATTAPLVLAPAMNREMWLAPATQANRDILQQRGVRLLGPGAGQQACGEIGPGRMLEPMQIVEQVLPLLRRGELAGVSVLVTAGPTYEAVDPVRFIGNRSSGKMGYAIAAAAREAGAQVTLISGPTALKPPRSVACIHVTSAEEMHKEAMARVHNHDIFISAAAVADYRPAEYLGNKVKKRDAQWALKLVRTPDILSAVASLADGPFTVGFAAETDNLAGNALDKLTKKSLDLIAANWVGAEKGIGTDDNALTVFWEGGHAELPLASKPVVARQLLNIVANRYRAKNPT